LNFHSLKYFYMVALSMVKFMQLLRKSYI